MTQSTDDRIKIKSIKGTTIIIKHVKNYASPEDFKKFTQKLKQVISQQESNAQEMSNQKSLFEEIDNQPLLEEEIRKYDLTTGRTHNY